MRLHPSSPAVAKLGAPAITVGPHIAFAPGRYRPDRADGLHMIGHELAHVVQQSKGGSAARAPGLAEGGFERQASRAAKAAIRGDRAPSLSPIQGPRVQRYTEDDAAAADTASSDAIGDWSGTASELIAYAVEGIGMIPAPLLPPGLAVAPETAQLIELLAPRFEEVWTLLNDRDAFLQQLHTYVQAQLPLVPGLARDYVETELMQLGIAAQHALAIGEYVAILGGEMLGGLASSIGQMLYELVAFWDLSREAAELEEITTRYQNAEIDTLELIVDVYQWLVGLANRYAGDITLVLVLGGAIMGGAGLGGVGAGAGALAGGVGAAPGGIAGIVAGASAGALEGLALTEAMQFALLIANVLGEVAQIGVHAASLALQDEEAITRAKLGQSPSAEEQAREQQERDEDHREIAAAILQLGIMAAMFLIGGVAANLGKKLVGRAIAAIAKLESKGAAELPVLAGPKAPKVPAARDPVLAEPPATPLLEGPREIEIQIDPETTLIYDPNEPLPPWESYSPAPEIEDAIEIVQPAEAVRAPKPPLGEVKASPKPASKAVIGSPEELLPSAGTRVPSPADEAVEELLGPQAAPQLPAVIEPTPIVVEPTPVAAAPAPVAVKGAPAVAPASTAAPTKILRLRKREAEVLRKWKDPALVTLYRTIRTAEMTRGRAVDVVPLAGICYTGHTIGDALDSATVHSLVEALVENATQMGREISPEETLEILRALRDQPIIAVKGTSLLRNFDYRTKFALEVGTARGEIHHVEALYLGGDHMLLIDLQAGPHDAIHALLDRLPYPGGKGTLHPSSLFKTLEEDFVPGLAVLDPDGSITLKSVQPLGDGVGAVSERWNELGVDEAGPPIIILPKQP